MNAIQLKDFEILRTLGHKMKGSGGGYGLDRISEISGKLEASAKAQNVCVIEQEVANLRDFLYRVEIVRP